MEKILGEIEINKAAKIIIRVRDYNKRNYFDMRQFFLSDTNEWLPTKKGVSIGSQNLPLVKKALEEAIKIFESEEQ